MTPDTWSDPHGGRLEFLIQTLRDAGSRTLDFYTDAALAVDRKADDSPVTEADRQAEQLVRQRVQAEWGEDGLLGEEFGTIEGRSGYSWVVDPIDGTKSFICGVPLYSTLLALLHRGEPIAGGIFLPALDELTVAATGQGAWHRPAATALRRQDGWQRARVSKRSNLEQAIFVTSQTDLFIERSMTEAYATLERKCFITRTWGDGYGYTLVATGRADLMVDPVVSPWDVAPILPILQEAGGQFTDWQGAATIRGGNGLGTNGHVHRQVLAVLAR